MRPLNLLVIHSEVPLRDQGSLSLRLWRMLELLAADGHDVTLLARGGRDQERYALELEGLGVRVVRGDPVRSAERGRPLQGAPLDVPALLREGRFDLALISLFEVAEQYLPLLRAHSPATRVIVDSVDVHWLREQRGAELSGDPGQLAAAERTRVRETAVYQAADALIAVSEPDLDALADMAPEVPRTVVSNIHTEEAEGPGFVERSGILFVGNFSHEPNVDAVVHFCATAWPAIRSRVPGARLTLVGPYAPPSVTALACEDVDVRGWVPELVPLLESARVSVAPLRFGAGVKGKIGEALSHGLPVVSTTIGVEGMGLEDGEHVLVADEALAFAEAVARLYGDEALWTRLARGGRDRVNGLLSPEVAGAALRDLLEQTVRTSFIAPRDAAGQARSLAAYPHALPPADPVSLVLPVADAESPADAGARAMGVLDRRGADPAAIPDVVVTRWPADPATPRNAIGLDGGEDAARLRSALAAPPARRRSAVRATVVALVADDPRMARAQIDALAAAGAGAEVEVLLAADAPGPELRALLAGASGATILSDQRPLGRRALVQRAVAHGAGEAAIVLEPGVVPAPGFAAPLLEALHGGAALAAPVVEGAHGFAAGADGALWPRSAAADGAPLDALAFACLAASRDLWLAAPGTLPARLGHAETQFAAFARERGPLAVARAAHASLWPAAPASVVICSHNRADELAGGVALLVASGIGRHGSEIVVVDNASTDATAEVAAVLAARHPGVVRWVAEERPGLSHARNAGADAARHEIVVFLDDDARPAPLWLPRLAHAFARPGVVMAGGPICALWPQGHRDAPPARGLERLYGVCDHGDSERDLALPDLVFGGNLAIARRALRAAGGFDPEFGVSPTSRLGGEEVAVAWRLQRGAIGTTRWVPGAAVGHVIPAERITDDYMLGRSLLGGIERPRRAVAIEGAGRDQVIETAGRAAAALHRALPLAGDLDVEAALAAIGQAPVPMVTRTLMADLLGEIAGCVAVLGESEAHLGALRLRVRPEHGRGVLGPLLLRAAA
jgi:glycosyltransferase involved in cell wall biosynthesis